MKIKTADDVVQEFNKLDDKSEKLMKALSKRCDEQEQFDDGEKETVLEGFEIMITKMQMARCVEIIQEFFELNNR